MGALFCEPRGSCQVQQKSQENKKAKATEPCTCHPCRPRSSLPKKKYTRTGPQRLRRAANTSRACMPVVPITLDVSQRQFFCARRLCQGVSQRRLHSRQRRIWILSAKLFYEPVQQRCVEQILATLHKSIPPTNVLVERAPGYEHFHRS